VRGFSIREVQERVLHNIELIKGLFDYFTSFIVAELAIDRQQKKIASGSIEEKAG
jgi:hypothetical protein